MERVAAAAGVTKPILYRHFGDRDGLVAALGIRVAEELTAEITDSLAAGGDPLTVLRRTVDAYLGFVERDPAVYRFVVDRVVVEQPGAAAVAGTFMARITDRVADAIRGQAESLDVPGIGLRADAIAHGLVGMVHGVGLWWAAHPDLPRHAVVDDLVETAWHGLAGMIQLQTGGVDAARSR